MVDGLNDMCNIPLESRKIIACAAAVPWKGGWAKEGAETESGWEVKAVCVSGEEQYARRGLAVRVMGKLEEELVRRRREEVERSGTSRSNGDGSGESGDGSGDGDRGDGKGKLVLWILAAECINGAYWRKRGYREVRRKTEGVGVWSCKTSFDMVVFRREVEFDVCLMVED